MTIDGEIPPDCASVLKEAMQNPDVEKGAFDLWRAGVFAHVLDDVLGDDEQALGPEAKLEMASAAWERLAPKLRQPYYLMVLESEGASSARSAGEAQQSACRSPPLFPDPQLAASCSKMAREDMGTGIDASEYVDAPDVLDAKVEHLARMIRASEAMCAYTGAGLSTSAGIGDYASKARGSKARVWDPQSGPHMEYLKELGPTTGHKVLTALERAGHLHQFINQNHDGLALKACFPQDKLNEIHGSWFDTRNPVVSMDGCMRRDLVDRLTHWEQTVDLVLSLGTSLSGLCADGVCEAAAHRAAESNSGLGLVIVSLTRTPLDSMATLRIFATIDDIMTKLAQKLRLARFMPTEKEVHQASKRSSLFRTYAIWYRDVLDRDKRYRREAKSTIHARAQP